MRRIVVLLMSLAAAFAVACSERDVSSTGPSALAATPGELAAKPPPATTHIPGTITFSDRTNDGITSDGSGTYVDGSQLEVGFYTASRDLVMTGGGRQLTFHHTNLGTTVYGMFMNVHGILDMSKGTSRTNVTAAFKRSSTDFFRFNPVNFSGTSYVTVDRDLDGIWTVTADNPSAQAALVKNRVLGIYEMPFQLTAQCVSAASCP
jgi:hypothetical protein